MELRNQDGVVLTTLATHSMESKEVQRSVKLVFSGYDGQYFLAQIWNAGDKTGDAVTMSRAENEIASKHSPQQQIALRMLASR